LTEEAAGMDELEDRLHQLERRVEHLEDDKSIRELIARYGYTADQGWAEAYVNLFARDGALELSRGPGMPDRSELGPNRDFPTAEVVIRFDGHDALRDFITDPDGHKRLEGSCLHFMGNNLTTHIDGDDAVAESYNFTVLRSGTSFTIYNAAINRWTLHKIDGRWRIQECKRRRPGTREYPSVLVTTE
jgi:hypothetical protein